MSNRKTNQGSIPKAIGPYSQSVAFENLVFTSRQIALDPISMNLVSRDIESQTEQVIQNLKNVLKTTVFLTNMNDFDSMNKVYATHFSHKPARSTIEVSRLPRGALIEIEYTTCTK